MDRGQGREGRTDGEEVPKKQETELFGQPGGVPDRRLGFHRGRPDLLDEGRVVTAQDVVDRGGIALREREVLLQHREPLLGLGMSAGRVQVVERAVADELDGAGA